MLGFLVVVAVIAAFPITFRLADHLSYKIAVLYGPSSDWPMVFSLVTALEVSFALAFIIMFKFEHWLKIFSLSKLAKSFELVNIARLLFICISLVVSLGTIGSMFNPSSSNSFAKGRTGVQMIDIALALVFLAIVFDLAREIIKDFKNEVGTNFQGANLKYINFNYAKLKNCKFENADTRYINWSRIEGSRSDIDFTHPRLQLLISRDGQNGKYLDMDLSNQNLTDVNLQNSNLSGTDLTRSNLQHANLSHANLSNVKAGSTDFRHVTLTGACIQNWAISSETRFDDVICEYVYFAPDQDLQSRRPLVGRFELGDFEKLIRPIVETVN